MHYDLIFQDQNSKNGTKNYLHVYVQIPKNITKLRQIL